MIYVNLCICLFVFPPSDTGIFTAPMKGVYVFRVFSKASGSRDKAVVAGLFKNGQHEISTYARQDSGFIGSSNGVSLLLEKGDKICVNLYPGYWIFDNEHHHSTFSGHLLFLEWTENTQGLLTSIFVYQECNHTRCSISIYFPFLSGRLCV